VLFPDWPPPPHRLIGIARLAASSPLLQAKQRVEYHQLPARSYITRCSSPRMPFEWTINPYRGCEFGCKYCYARYTHEFMELREPRQFEEQIFAKLWDEPAFRAELRRIPRHQPIAIGTATDPYQPAERRFGLTRGMLEVFAADRGRAVWITTKGDLVTRDSDLLSRIAEHNQVHVNMTITTLDEPLARLLEPYAPRPALRLAAISRLTAAGIPCGVLCCPVMPLLNDSERSLDALAHAAADAGACWFHGNPLFLKPCSKRVFLPFIEERFPQLARRYRERFERAEFPRSGYVDTIARRVQAVRERYSLNQRATRYDPVEFSDQLNLWNE
jgi:DNA repair photolyase